MWAALKTEQPHVSTETLIAPTISILSTIRKFPYILCTKTDQSTHTYCSLTHTPSKASQFPVGASD